MYIIQYLECIIATFLLINYHKLYSSLPIPFPFKPILRFNRIVVRNFVSFEESAGEKSIYADVKDNNNLYSVLV